jgi:hypothetical protein
MDLFEKITGRKSEFTPSEAANFIKNITKDVPPMTKEQAKRFYDRMMEIAEATRGK